MTKQSDVINDPKYRAVLDHGFAGLIDTMGNDSAVVQAARVSYGAGTKAVNADRGLIRYLMRHYHTTPFEMCDLKFHVKMPIFVARQWHRHRTASINEESARYSEMSDEFYVPEAAYIQPQAKDNKQGRAGALSELNANGVRWYVETAYDNSHQTYKVLLGDLYRTPGADVFYDPFDKESPLFDEDFNGVAREIARTVMPVGAYTEFYWKANLHNVFNFMRLRADPHAQYEIRVFAEAMIELARPLFPLCFEAFDDYVRGALSISRMEKILLIDLLKDQTQSAVATLLEGIRHAGSVKAFAETWGMNVREFTEFAHSFELEACLP